MSENTLRKLKAYDDAREGIPGEHLMVLGAGLAAWLLTRRSPSLMLRTLGMVAGTALVGRAAPHGAPIPGAARGERARRSREGASLSSRGEWYPSLIAPLR